MDAEQGVLSEVVGWISGLHLSFIYMTVAIAIIMTIFHTEPRTSW